MKSKKSFLSLGIIVLVLFLGVGYAVVSSVYLNIGGTASVANADLKVEITNAVASTTVASKEVDFNHTLSTDKLSSNFTLNGMELNETVSITYTVTNNETDVDAVLTGTDVDLTNSNSDFFDVDYEITDAETDLENNDKTMTVVVNVSLIQTPVTESEGTTTVGLKLTASPKGGSTSSGSSSEVTPLKFGEKYYLVSIWGLDVKDNNSWYIFYEDGHLEESNEDKSLAQSGYTYTSTNIYNSALADEFTISSDGKYLYLAPGSDDCGTFVIESEFNKIKELSIKFGEKYYCITDNVSSNGNSIVGQYLIGYPDGSGVINYVSGRRVNLPFGSNTYSQGEIYSSALSEGNKFLISDDGLTLTEVNADGEELYIYMIENDVSFYWSPLEVVNNVSVIIDNSVISDLPQENPKFVKVSSKVPQLGFMLNTFIDFGNGYDDIPFDSVNSSENGAYIFKYLNDKDIFYLIEIPSSGEYFGSTFTESGIYAFDIGTYDPTVSYNVSIFLN